MMDSKLTHLKKDIPIYKKEDDFTCKRKVLRMTVSGFSMQGIVDMDDIKRAVDALPNRHLEKLGGLVYEPVSGHGPMGVYAYEQDEFNGYVTPMRKNHRVLIHRIPDLKQFFHTLYHEIGHHVFYEVITQKEKKRWVTEVYPESPFVTPYASRNASEDFAETYATYLLDNEKLLRFGAKYTFMDRVVF